MERRYDFHGRRGKLKKKGQCPRLRIKRKREPRKHLRTRGGDLFEQRGAGWRPFPKRKVSERLARGIKQSGGMALIDQPGDDGLSKHSSMAASTLRQHAAHRKGARGGFNYCADRPSTIRLEIGVDGWDQDNTLPKGAVGGAFRRKEYLCVPRSDMRTKKLEKRKRGEPKIGYFRPRGESWNMGMDELGSETCERSATRNKILR